MKARLLKKDEIKAATKSKRKKAKKKVGIASAVTEKVAQRHAVKPRAAFKALFAKEEQ
jgi:hypothetical protein